MKISDPIAYISELRRHANELRVMADNLERDQRSSNVIGLQDREPIMKPLEFAKVVETLMELRKIRDRFIPPRLVESGGWDILLFLFKETAERGSASITKTSHIESVSQTTALRTIDRLEMAGFVEKLKCSRGPHRTDVRLTEIALKAMMRFFASTHLAIQYEKQEVGIALHNENDKISFGAGTLAG